MALRFAREDYAVALAARDARRLAALAAETGARAFTADLSRETDVATLFEAVESGVGPIDAVAFVAATRVQSPFAQLSLEDFERAWRQGCLSGFLVAREAARRMLPRGRELGPKGIHVATVLIDGAIDSRMMWREYRSRMESLGPDGAVRPEAAAEAYWQLHNQPRNAWSFEIDLRPWQQAF